ncbi:hypothetical protein BH11PLA2_BH11PLA2_50410 [soil metagenome]
MRLFALAVVALGGMIAFAAPSAAQTITTPFRVTLSGTAAPAGGNYSTFSSSPVLNASGQVAFQATLTGGTSTQGIFAGTPGSLNAAALQGTAAPAGGNYIGFSLTPVLNASGQAAFGAGLTGGSSTRGVFAGTPGAVAAIALVGTAAPAGGNYSFFGIPVLNDSGQVGFFANLTGGTSTRGIFAGTPGSLTTAALQGTAAPAGGNYSLINAPVLNASGQVAFLATLTGGLSTQGIFAGTPSAVAAIALQGTAAPAGGNYSSIIFPPVLNASGQVAFQADLTGGSSINGIFAGTPGAVAAIALQGTASPAGGNYSSFQTPPVLNASGQVAFFASMTGGTSTGGIFAGTPGAVAAIALVGTAAPAGGNYLSFNPFTSNASGQVAFTATLNGTGVTTANDNGLYVGTAGSLVNIVREGDIIDVDPSSGVDNRTISAISFTTGSGGQDGLGMSLNDSGQVVYRLTFTDGSSGIFTSQVTPVPEPSLVLGVAGLSLLAGRGRKRFAK